MTLSRDQILASPIPSETVDVPEWEGKVTIRGLNAHERDEYEQSLLERLPDGTTRVKEHHDNVRSALVARCLVDDKGERLFADDEIGEVGKLDGRVIDRLWKKARELSGMGEEAEEQAAEGFDMAQGEDSSTG